ncbi:MAG: GDSL-type esterase/lipase family protein [Daejeonella sp.]|nr:GDSL-type esterase/lipase family protein [Daejeonella sp.]
MQTQSGKKNNLKSFLGGMLIFSISIIIGLLIGEVIIRLMYKKEMVLYPRYHTDVTYGDFKIRRIRPNMTFTHTSFEGSFNFKTNNKGFRNDKDINYKKEKGEIRVIALGDSHTQGYDVNQDETFSSFAENMLNKNGLKSIVINAGVSGFSTAEELVFLENEGYKYKPDYVVVALFANDYQDNIRSDLFELRNDSVVVKNHEYIPGVSIQNKLYKYGIFRWLGEKSYLYGYAFNTVWDFIKKLNQKAASGKETELAIAVNPNTNYSEELMKKLIGRFHDYCKAQGIKLIILDIPQLDPIVSTSPSIPKNLVPHVKKSCDTLFNYDNMITDYSKISLIHVKHGSRHISAETHKMLGQKISEYILSDHKAVN